MRKKAILLPVILVAALFSGCTKPTTPPSNTTPSPTNPSSNAPIVDTVTAASVVGDNDAFQKAISSSGKWIIALTKDLTFDTELSLDGVFNNGKKDDKGNDIIQRKIALYTQDANRNVTARFTLTVPKFNIISPEASIEHGTFKGDLYVSAKDFKLIDAKVDGNVYFTTDEAKSTFNVDTKSSVTGVQELKK